MIEIREVKGKRALRRFIDFPLSLYKDCPYFTPYLFEDELANLTPGKNPASSYCDFKLMMAYKDGKASAGYARLSVASQTKNTVRSVCASTALI